MTYRKGDWVYWRTPPNVSMEWHGVPPNCLVRVQLSTDNDNGIYETEIPGYGWVSVLESEILELA